MDQSPNPEASSPRKMVTYSSSFKKKRLEQRAESKVPSPNSRDVKRGNAARAAQGRPADVVKKNRPRIRYPPSSRRSGRLRAGRIGDASPLGLELSEVQARRVLLIAPLPNQVRPIIDKHRVVIGVHAGPPLGEEAYFRLCVKRVSGAFRRLYRNGVLTFDYNDGESYLRSGMDFGVRGPRPHMVVSSLVKRRELYALREMEEMKYMAAYQTELLRQYAPRRHAQQKSQIEQLIENDLVTPAFEGSAFTTAQFNLGNGMSLLGRNTYDEFGSLRAITVLGEYDPMESSWFLYWHEEECDRFALYCPPGTTLLVPGSIVRWAFSAIKQGETRYLFQQYFNAALGRWVEQGFRSDADFEEEASEEEWMELFHERRVRVITKTALLSRLDEFYVV
ncbi:hypothetical protein C8R47DRAFT_1061700 [Mycena vitilis]|nr:hypothetical protein C8R47DRAFT_1061700 [Mycena vitilis]